MIGTSVEEEVVLDQPQEQIGQPAVRPWWRSAYAGFLGALIIAYVAGYGVLLMATDGLPYVMDNNESFSTLVHATNLYQFGLSKSWGLTDEAYGPNPDAHPFVHSHQGNFPRLFGWVIYVLGARTIESQIIVTTFTVGLVAALLAFYVFARLGGPLLAFVACLVLLSDYIHVTQWHVNTYRVWHFFLVFSSLVCAYGIGSSRRRLWLALTFVNTAFLFYSELISVAFTGLLAWLFVLKLYWRRPRLVIASTIAQVTGGATALLILVIQLVGYVGWSEFLLDVSLTFNARNYGATDGAIRQQINEFYERNNILFWHNYVDSSTLRSLSAFIEIHSEKVLQVYTPLLTLIVLILAVGWLLGLSWGYASIWRVRRRSLAGARQLVLAFRDHLGEPLVYANGSLTVGIRDLSSIGWRRLSIAYTAVCYVLLWGPTSLVLYMVIQGEAFVGLLSEPASIGVRPSALVVATIGGTAATVLLTKMVTGRWLAPGRIPPGRLVLTAILLLCIGVFVGQQPYLYDQTYRAIWFDPIAAIVSLWVERVALLAAIGLAVGMCLLGTQRVLGPAWTSRLRGLGTYLACSGLAYAITYYLATGYVNSGYITRSAPLPVFFFGVLVAFAACIVVAAIAHACSTGPGRLSQLTCNPRPLASWAPRATGAVAALLLVWMAGYWVVLNRSYVIFFPPDQLAFVKQFANPPLRGKSAAVNTYAAPIAVMTGSWAYYDPVTNDGIVDRHAEGDGGGGAWRTYLWLADKQSNPAYDRPDYFVCFHPPSLDELARRLTPGNDLKEYDCREAPIVRRIESRNQRTIQNTLVARDRANPSRWAIVQLDWDFPPYLVELEDSQDLVRLVMTPRGDRLDVQVQYRYRQQEGVSERGSVVRLHAAGADGRWCVYERSSSRSTFTLPADFRGLLRASVTPRSQTKAGREAFGKTLTIGDGRGSPCVGKE